MWGPHQNTFKHCLYTVPSSPGVPEPDPGDGAQVVLRVGRHFPRGHRLQLGDVRADVPREPQVATHVNTPRKIHFN